MRSIGRIVLALLLMLEGVVTAARLSQFVSSLAVYDWIALTLLGLRALIGALALTTGWWLLRQRAAAVPLARWALLLSAIVTTFETGWALAPSDLNPVLRWPVVMASWVYAGAWLLFLRSGGPKPGEKPPPD